MKVNYGCGQYTFKVFGENGELCSEDEGRNIITDKYLDEIINYSNQQMLCRLYIGKGAKSDIALQQWGGKTYITSGANILATQSSSTVTTNGAFFTSVMVGQTIHFENDNYANGVSYDCKILSFVSATEVIVNTSHQASLGSPNFDSRITVWNTGRYAMFDPHDGSSGVDSASHLGTTWPILKNENVSFSQVTSSDGNFITTTLSVKFTSTVAKSTAIQSYYIINELGLTAHDKGQDELFVRIMFDNDRKIYRNNSFELIYTMYVVEQIRLSDPSKFLSSDPLDYFISNIEEEFPKAYYQHTASAKSTNNQLKYMISGLMPCIWNAPTSHKLGGALDMSYNGMYPRVVLRQGFDVRINDTTYFNKTINFGVNQIWGLKLQQKSNIPLKESFESLEFDIYSNFTSWSMRHTLYKASLGEIVEKNNSFDFFDKDDPLIFELQWNRTFSPTPVP